MMSKRKDAQDPLWLTIREGGPFHAKGHLKDYIVRLKETDRADGIEELKRRHPNEIKD